MYKISIIVPNSPDEILIYAKYEDEIRMHLGVFLKTKYEDLQKTKDVVNTIMDKFSVQKSFFKTLSLDDGGIEICIYELLTSSFPILNLWTDSSEWTITQVFPNIQEEIHKIFKEFQDSVLYPNSYGYRVCLKSDIDAYGHYNQYALSGDDLSEEEVITINGDEYCFGLNYK